MILVYPLSLELDYCFEATAPRELDFIMRQQDM